MQVLRLLPLVLASLALASQTPLTAPDAERVVDVSKEPWTSKYGSQEDLGYSGPLSFSHMPYSRCLDDANARFDIAILGFPFDTTVSYRPGARFGPYGIRSGSRRQRPDGWTLAWGQSPTELGASLIDCGDVPLSAYDNLKALDQMEAAYTTLLGRPVASAAKATRITSRSASLALDGVPHPAIVTLGGDHTITLPILRSLSKFYGKVSVIHFDSHFDTGKSGNETGKYERITHGSYFTVAYEEGHMTNRSVHGGIRQKMRDHLQLRHDEDVGFEVISAEDIDDYGLDNVVSAIRARVGDTPVYLTLDIDVIDPAFAPATGTPEAGGWSVREMKRILRGLTGLNFVGADLVEVAPAYDNADVTSIAAADLVHDFLAMIQMEAPPPKHNGPFLMKGKAEL
ncbi:Arginase/deacetylase [Schizophyllum commune Tattone D]|nr:Arginase/deacetylase [Schizophyllum commune Tattone D]